ncbi:hypothetical protein PINS_up008507 [Pythium insidiosum]|nr:hypothetical protein PINS_up008507 [Pythium insidiosum]
MMLRGKSAMGFKSVKRVEVKAETTTPGEVRTTTDVNGVRVNTSRARRTLPKLEFVVEENGAILHGPQRGLYPFISSGADQFFSTASTAHASEGAAGASGNAATRNAAVSGSSPALLSPSSTGPLHPSLLREFPSVHHASNSNNQDGEELATVGDAAAATLASNAVPMKDCVLNDSRATTLAIKYDNSVGKFVCGSSIERFSGHTGVCRVLGSKKYPVIPHRLQIGDLLRIGSVGLVVCELNRTTQEDGLETLTEDEYQYIKENYLSVPLQQTFRPTDPRSGQPLHGSNNQSHDGGDDDRDEEVDDEVDDRRGPRPIKLRSGETSDEGESEEDAAKRLADEDDLEHDHAAVGDGGARRRAQRLKDGLANGREKRFCYICYDGDEEPDTNPLVAPCNCKGDTKFVHLECLQRWNNNLDADGSNPNHKMCAVTNTDGLDVCSICKATYLTSVRLEDGRVVSLMAKKLPPPYVTFAVVTQHETRSRSTALTNTRFQLSFANLPRGQQFLTIGRSTTNNMTLRYRTVSQLHAKIKFEDNEFHLHDASSSNGTMLFLSKPVELEWNKVVHVKIGRTILTLKPKKRWKWSGGADGDDEVPIPTAVDMSALTSPKPDNGVDDGEAHHPESQRRSSGTNRFEIQSSALSDPSAELLSSPYAAVLRQPLSRTFTAPFPYPSHQFNPIFPTSSELDGELENIRLSDLLDDGGLLGGRGRASSSSSAGGGFVGTPRRVADTRASFGDVPSRLGDLGLTTSRLADRRETRPSFDYMERLSQMTLGSPRFLERMSAPDRFDRA